MLRIITLHFSECRVIVSHSCPLAPKINHGYLGGPILLAHEGPGVAELRRRGKAAHSCSSSCEEFVVKRLLWPSQTFHGFTPTFGNSWAKALHARAASPVHSLFLTYFEGSKLFCLGLSFYHKIYTLLAKIRASHENSVNPVYIFWNIKVTSAVKDWSKCRIIVSTREWLWGTYKEAEMKGCSCSGCRNVNFNFTQSFFVRHWSKN